MTAHLLVYNNLTLAVPASPHGCTTVLEPKCVLRVGWTVSKAMPIWVVFRQSIDRVDVVDAMAQTVHIMTLGLLAPRSASPLREDRLDQATSRESGLPYSDIVAGYRWPDECLCDLSYLLW